MSYRKMIYDFVREETAGLDSFYEDYLVDLVGWLGVGVLVENQLIESCGVINGRRLYVLCPWKE